MSTLFPPRRAPQRPRRPQTAHSPLRFSENSPPVRDEHAPRSSLAPVSQCRKTLPQKTGMRPRFPVRKSTPKQIKTRHQAALLHRPSRFLAINKTAASEKNSKLSTDDGSNYSTPPLSEQDSNVPKSHLQFVHNCTIRQFTQQYSAETDNLYKNTPVFRQTRSVLRFYAEIRENRFTNGHFHGNIYILSPRA